MNTRILTSALTIVAIAAAATGATFAFFSDSASSTNNVFSTGTLDLKLDDTDEVTPAETVTASLGTGSTPLGPGLSTSGFISLHNSGDFPIDKVVFGANETANNNVNGDLADVLNLTVKTGGNNTCADGTDQTSAIAAQLGNHDSILTLSELNNSNYDALPALNVNDTYYVCVDATMDTGAGNVYQGNSITEDFVFQGIQTD